MPPPSRDRSQHDVFALALALERFDVRLAGGASPADARSAAGIHRVELRGGGRAYLKVTAAAVGRSRAEAERELRFYRGAAPAAPVLTPALLDTLVVDEGVALLLEDAGEQRDAAAWSRDRWRALGRDLARLHGMALPAGDWARPDDLLSALAVPDLGPVLEFWSGHLPRLDDLLADRTALGDRLGTVPPVFVHGDCHTANVVHRTAGGHDVLVFCDWQAAGVGRATSDLALLSVRATPSGARVPAVLVEEYLVERARAGSARDGTEFRRLLALEELAVLVFQWPPYAAYNGPAAVARVRRRARYLAARYLAERVSG
ncbi:aminoglycoside phosphotransferase family protein [Promicromonospora sp. NPDC090134]|uniref:aminoglycoside phosphotransferase family protein n=1 Tax=Promicromonospora sp. NPDC090134 TaxID=3364408 RepID=UPI00381559FE